MRIQKQMGLGFLGVVAVSGLATTIALASQAFTRRVGEAVSAESRLHASAALLERAVTKLVEGASMVARTEDPMGRQLVAEGRAELTASLSAIEGVLLDPGMAAELDELKVLAGSVAAANAGVLAIARTRNGTRYTSEADERLQQRLDALDTRRRALTLKVEVFADHARARARASQLAAQELWGSATAGVVLLLAVALASAIVFAIVLARRIAKPIERLAEVARRVGGGEITARSGAYRPDEVGELARVFDQMVSDLQAAQVRLGRSERLAGIGELTVTLQHELNNPIQGILGALRLVLQDVEGMTESTREAIDMIHEATTRMSVVVDKLRRITEPVSKTYLGNIQMLDLDKSAP